MWWLLLSQRRGSRGVGFSSCGTRAELPPGMWDCPGRVSPALASRFSTIGPTGNPTRIFSNHSLSEDFSSTLILANVDPIVPQGPPLIPEQLLPPLSSGSTMIQTVESLHSTAYSQLLFRQIMTSTSLASYHMLLTSSLA